MYVIKQYYKHHIDGIIFPNKIYNLRTKESRLIDWIECKDVYMWINWDIRTVVYGKKDGKYYLEKFSADWQRTVQNFFLTHVKQLVLIRLFLEFNCIGSARLLWQYNF